MPLISINIVTYNSSGYIQDCLDSLFNQTFKDFSILIIDNGSIDETVNLIRGKYGSKFENISISILQNFKNLGFAYAHNQGIKLSKSPWILVLNPDIVLENNFLEKIYQAAYDKPKIFSAGGKILRMQLSKEELAKPIKSAIIDSAGIKILKNRKFIDRGAEEIDCGQYDVKEKVFGISAAALFLKKEALEDIKITFSYKGRIIEEYFDEDLFSYKEDVDLAWRAQLYGWHSLYAPEAKGYHLRSARSTKGFLENFKSRYRRSEIIKKHSYKNHYLVLVKNDYFINFFIHFPRIIFEEIKKHFYILFFELKTLRALFLFLRILPKTLIKRRIIMKNAQLKQGQFRKLFS